MCELPHRIEVTNVQNCETFQHPLVLLKGSIDDPCEGVQLKVVSGQQTPVSFCHTIEDTDHHAKHRKFRLLLRLQEGKNEIALRCCTTEVRLAYYYSRPNNPHTIIPLYIVCKGHHGRYQSHESDQRNTIENGCRKVTLAIELLQCLYAEKLHEHGFGRKTFTLGRGCVPFYSQLDYIRSTSMCEAELWQHFATELLQSEAYDMSRAKVVAFLSSTHFDGITDGDFSYANIRSKTTGHAALGGGGLALFGTGCLYTWPTTLEGVAEGFLNRQPVDCRQLLDDSNYRRTFGGCYATTLGSVCHEMGHTFDLGHTPDGSIMGDGFDGIEHVFVGRTEPYCNGSGVGPRRLVNTKPGGPSGKLTQLKRPGDVFRQLAEAKCNDGIFFAPNSALALNHHRWFNANLHDGPGANETIQYKIETRVATSYGAPIVLVELRLTVNGMMQKHWTFQEAPTPQSSFLLPKLPNLVNQTLFIMNAMGTILKVDLCRME
ncbi:uncharacterized protein LOC131206971 [Anopheles bellator]|uniref:uncharacterized protein LOC131206971 n=1 Tax=Anopheles bellator TaxID=139047 RepID=UPI0026491E2C|nr:uncharacterized protein LOC131206971 [Anopheles bellator]